MEIKTQEELNGFLKASKDFQKDVVEEISKTYF